MNPVWIAFGLTLLAGIATGIGSIIAFLANRTNFRFLSVATGFSAGVMLYVSFVEILPKSLDSIMLRYGAPLCHWLNAASFFCGILFIGLIDNLIPAAENPHETHSEEETMQLRAASAGSESIPAPSGKVPLKKNYNVHSNKLLRMGLFTALAIGIHNFPEGLVTFLAALKDPTLGAAIAMAVALHNIPEGISVSVPIFYATGNRRKAFIYSFLSGLAEPIGAGIAYIGLRLVFGGGANGIPPQFLGFIFGGIAGIMVYISLDELLPTSRAYGKGHDSLFGLVGGMAVMAISLLLMK